MPLCLRCDPVLHTGYDPYKPWPPGWGGTPGLTGLGIFSVTPNSAVVLTADLPVTVTGQEFTATTEFLLDGATPLADVGGTAVINSATSATITIKPSVESVPRTATITCRDGAKTGFGAVPFYFTAAPVLTVTCPLQPASVLINSGAQTITVKGTLFTAASIVMLDGIDQATTFVDANTLTFSFTPGSVAATNTVSVKDGATTATTTCPLQTTLTPLLFITCPVVPATTPCGTPDFQATVNGGNFTATSVVTLDGVAMPTTFVSASQLTWTVPSAAQATARIATVGAKDGTATAVQTCPFEFTLVVIKPTPTYVWPDLIGQDDPVKTVTVTGTNFDATTQVILTQTPMVTTYISPTQVSFVTQSPMWTNGTMTLRVRNGGTVQGEGTTTIPFGVWNNPASTGVVSLMPTSAAANSGIVAVQMGVSDAPGAPLSQVTVDDVPVPTTGSGTLSFQIDTTGVAPGTIRKCSVRVGHDHPEGHDNITPQPMQYGDFTIT